MAYALTYRAADRTLTSEEVDKAHERLVKKVSSATGARSPRVGPPGAVPAFPSSNGRNAGGRLGGRLCRPERRAV